MDAGNARNRVSDGNEGTVGNVEKSTVMRTDQVAEEHRGHPPLGHRTGGR